MLCRDCKVLMKPGTRYERKDGKIVTRRFDRCPKCFFKKYNNSPNPQKMSIKLSDKSNIYHR